MICGRVLASNFGRSLILQLWLRPLLRIAFPVTGCHLRSFFFELSLDSRVLNCLRHRCSSSSLSAHCGTGALMISRSLLSQASRYQAAFNSLWSLLSVSIVALLWPTAHTSTGSIRRLWSAMKCEWLVVLESGSFSRDWWLLSLMIRHTLRSQGCLRSLITWGFWILLRWVKIWGGLALLLSWELMSWLWMIYHFFSKRECNNLN
jgi:hypothetical protein